MNHPWFERYVDQIDSALGEYFRHKDMTCHPLDRAMEYSVLAGGKRMRPLLVVATCSELGGDPRDAIPFSLAPEMLHTYSLIHDDLPSMDNDDMRRGKPTNHKVFGEAMAVLAGDALHSEAFSILARTPHPRLTPQRRLAVIDDFCDAVGRRGMVAGQVMDIEGQGKSADLERLSQLHRRKTGALIRFSVRLGAQLASASADVLGRVSAYADAIGLMFQIVDDVLDVDGDPALLGKTPGKDADQEKVTFPNLMGIDESRKFADSMLEEALQALTSIPQKEKLLVDIARYFREREH